VCEEGERFLITPKGSRRSIFCSQDIFVTPMKGGFLKRGRREYGGLVLRNYGRPSL